MESSAGASNDCDAEESEDSSSSFQKVHHDMKQLNLEESKKEEPDALSTFREQWQRELEASPTHYKNDEKDTKTRTIKEQEPEDINEKATRLFLRGIELERCGKLYEAVKHYKQAVQLQPDVERKLYEAMDHRESVEVEIVKEQPRVEPREPTSDDEETGEDIPTKFQRILAKKGQLCEPLTQQKFAHLSWLPYELVLVILRWVVSSELDVLSLERTASVCRGLYLAARDNDIWRSLCLRTWGLDCGTPKSLNFLSWRDMYIERPRLRLNGCYISKTTYLRHGENSFQDAFYQPWYVIEYYRYLRFFPDGLVLMWTTADEPAACVNHLKHRSTKTQGVMAGHYRLITDRVIIVVKKQNEKKPVQTNTRFRSRKKEPKEQEYEQKFHLELQLRNVKRHRNWQLSWRCYSASTRKDQFTAFDLTSHKYPPFAFSPVLNYVTEAEAPLD